MLGVTVSLTVCLAPWLSKWSHSLAFQWILFIWSWLFPRRFVCEMQEEINGVTQRRLVNLVSLGSNNSQISLTRTRLLWAIHLNSTPTPTLKHMHMNCTTSTHRLLVYGCFTSAICEWGFCYNRKCIYTEILFENRILMTFSWMLGIILRSSHHILPTSLWQIFHNLTHFSILQLS